MRAPQPVSEALGSVLVHPRTRLGSREPCTGRSAMIDFSRFSASGQWCGQLSGHPQSPDRPGRSLSRRNLLKPSYVTPENRLRHPSAAAPPSKKLAACASVPLRTNGRTDRTDTQNPRLCRGGRRSGKLRLEARKKMIHSWENQPQTESWP